MTDISEQLLHDVASRVARRVASSAEASAPLPARYTLLALSGEGSSLVPSLDRLLDAGETVAVADCPAGAAGALAAALARLPRLRVAAGEGAFDAGRLVAGADRVLAPSMDLALASRVAAMQSDTPASRAVLRALLAGVPVDASLDERDFAVAPGATEGARRALEEVVARLRSLGVAIGAAPRPARAAAAGLPPPAGGGPHPSQERFHTPEPLDEFVEFLESRPCMIETGKPCVACGACEARGF